jgi:hypothetical protein
VEARWLDGRRAVADVTKAARNRAPSLGFARGEAGEDKGATAKAKAMVVLRG